MAQKSRSELQKLFKTGEKPSQEDFADFIESTLNIKDDGIENPAGADTPLKITAQGEDEKLLDFYTGEAKTWSINQKLDENKIGLNISNSGGSKLFIDSISGNVGIGKPNPAAKLDVNGRIKDKTGFVMPVGAVIPYAGTTAPEGWLLCNGQQVTDTKYAELAIVLGLSGVPFNVPNYQQKFLVGADGTGEYQVGATGGKTSVTLNMAEMPQHDHSGFTKTDGEHEHIEQETSRADNDDNDSVTQNICVQGTNYWRRDDGKISKEGSNHSHSFQTDQQGKNHPHENRPPFVALNYIIKY